MLRFEKVCAKAGKRFLTREVDLCLRQGEIVGVLGKNGSGKTSLLRCLHGLCSYEGRITLREKDLKSYSPRELARLLSILHQHRIAPALTVEQLVQMGRVPYLGLGSRLGRADLAAAEQALEQCDLTALRTRLCTTLSGGERQRAYLALCLCQNTPYLLLDEPAAALDRLHQRELFALLRRLAKEENKGILLVHHDPSQLIGIADRILVLEEGRSVFFGETEACLSERIIERTLQCQRYEIIEETATRYFFL